MTGASRLRSREPIGKGRMARLVTAILSVSLLSGCMSAGGGGGGSATMVTAGVPERVVTQIINNSCNDETITDSESLTTGEVKGLSKVKDGFGIPYDEHADNYVNPPVPVTDDSYEANKERGIGYCGYEAHLKDTLKDGPGAHDDNDIALEYNEPGTPFPTMLTPEEEKYGCCMRWEYSALNASGGISGYLDFLKGNGSGHMQYVAIHALNTDKWCICCPYDYGPGHGLPTAGGGKYSGGRIGGVTPAVTKVLGFQENGGCPDEALTEWWWVENSDQVKCGEVSDLSQFEQGGSSSKGGSSSSGSSKKASVSTAITTKTLAFATEASGSSGDSSVSIEPANPNSFISKMELQWQHGSLPKDKVKYIMMHDTESGTDSAEAIINAWKSDHIAAHFMVDKEGKIFQCVPIDRIAHHAGWAGYSANEKFDVPPERDDMVGSKNGDEDYGMAAYCIGIEIVHEHNEGPYPEAQLNALDRLVAYIDKEVGSKPKIIDHKEWASQPDSTNQKQDCSDDFPLQNYKDTRNHNGVSTMEEAEEAKASGACSDSEEEEEEDSIGGEQIAEMAVKVAGVASPESQRASGILTVEPTDARWKDYVEQKKKVYGPSGDPSGIWAACCRMSIAVTASGADPDLPVGPCSAQHEYLSRSSKWQVIGQLQTGDKCDEVLKPGDFLVWTGPEGGSGAHTMVYVGNEAVKKKFPSSDANFVEAHYNSGYPQATRHDYVTYGDFTIFRIKAQGKKGSAYDGDEDALIYMQGDSKWGSAIYQGPCDIASHGCGCCATAMALTLLFNESITPDALAKKMQEYADPKGLTYCAYGVGTVYGPWSETLLGIWGDELDITGIDATWQGIKSALESGSMVVFGVGGAPVKTESGGQRYTDGHVMMAYKADGDKIWTKGSAEGGHVSYTEGEFGSIGCGAAFQLTLKSGAKKSSKKKKKSSSKSSGAGSQANTSRYVFIGDSRTNQMALCLRDSLRSACVTGEVTAGSKSPDGKDEFWIAKGSMGYPWFEETAVPAMNQNVKSGDAIIIWMGVNGAPSYVDEYATLVNAKAKEWKAKGATTYYASVGPMNGDMARQNGMGGSDENVVKFNTELKAKLSSDVGWIDVYDAIKDDYGSPDGVHYDQQTYQKVYDTMTKGAVSSGGAEDEEEEDGEEGEEGTPINVDVTRA